MSVSRSAAPPHCGQVVCRHADEGAPPALDLAALDAPRKALRRQLHETIQKVSDDYGRRHTFNTPRRSRC